MRRSDKLAKLLAVAGAALAWFPLLAPVLVMAGFYAREGVLRFDFLIPAELGLFAFFGGGLLLWGAIRLGYRVKLIGGSLGSAAALLAGGQYIAVATGLASGETPTGGFWWGVVTLTLALYAVCIGALGVGGVLLARKSFETNKRQGLSNHHDR